MSPLSPNQLRWEAQKGKSMSLHHNVNPFWGSVHNIPGSGYPGSRQTLSLLQVRFWWPSMTRDVIWYVRSCSVCAMSKTPRHLPVGKLVPLPAPRRPWSQICRGGKSTKIFYSSKSTITLLKFYLSTSKSTSLKIYSSKSKK